MERKYSTRKLKAVVNGEYMPRERALAQQCLDVEADRDALRDKNKDLDEAGALACRGLERGLTERDALKRLLKRLEWSGTRSYGRGMEVCPICDGLKGDPHNKRCHLKKLLGA